MFSSTLVRIAALTLILAGCGTKGPLTLPPKDTMRPPAAAVPDTPAPASVAPSKNDSKVPAQ
ncbi:lipoprotein [Methyloversatilis sp. XJ19-49]|uniref:LPS translocon maturation chaperone LptM n=1 Tax=Methyloversatilis sp. XJ19-49 TaxID=2963429 RepID=UPI00211C33A2|nr:lipoprotein [Methyloversatilis sp. XJ19-49]MCQ9379704.1 lipoprotein [Methyloversatilis sp. XJ19-49]